MADLAITFARSARKDLERLAPNIADRILEKVAGLAVNPRPPAASKLKGDQGLWRLRVGDYRVVYTIDDARQTLDVSHVRHRREVYRDL